MKSFPFTNLFIAAGKKSDISTNRSISISMGFVQEIMMIGNHPVSPHQRIVTESSSILSLSFFSTIIHFLITRFHAFVFSLSCLIVNHVHFLLSFVVIVFYSLLLRGLIGLNIHLPSNLLCGSAVPLPAGCSLRGQGCLWPTS